MNKLTIIRAFLCVAFFTSCSSEEQSEMTENAGTNPTLETEKAKAVDYIPPSPNESSAGDTKRKRKFYIR